MPRNLIGVLALQGDFELHRKALEDIGRPAMEVRIPEHLSKVKGLIIPGGESTTVGKLLVSSGLAQAIKERVQKETLSVFGTCMGVIVMSKQVENRHKDQFSLGILDITVARNAYGRQVDSFEVDIPVCGIHDNGSGGNLFHAVFIRAPQILETGPEVEVLAQFKNRPVFIRQGRILGATFHPEVITDTRIHEFFCKLTDNN